MLARLSILAAITSLAAALSVNVPQDPRTDTRVRITWSRDTGDPSVFSVTLFNTVFNDQYAIANNVDASLEELEVLFPTVPVRDGYELRLFNIGNINDVYARSAPFSIGPNLSTTVSSTSASSTTSRATSTSPLSTPSSTSSTTTLPGSTITRSSSSSTSTTESATSPAASTSNAASSLVKTQQYPVAGLAAVAGSILAGVVYVL